MSHALVGPWNIVLFAVFSAAFQPNSETTTPHMPKQASAWHPTPGVIKTSRTRLHGALGELLEHGGDGRFPLRGPPSSSHHEPQ